MAPRPSAARSRACTRWGVQHICVAATRFTPPQLKSLGPRHNCGGKRQTAHRMESLIGTTVLIIAAILLYRFRAPLLGALHWFDARNVARIREEIGDRRDPVAHYKHTLRLAEEQVEEVSELSTHDSRTGLPIARYVFEGEQF